MTNDSNDDIWTRIFYSNCLSELPHDLCAFANVCGLVDAILWFFVFIPQIYSNCKRRSVEGLSTYWIIANMTAAVINFFFVFEWGVLPIFVKIWTCYSPVIQAILLIEILAFTKWNRNKWVGIVLCLLLWTVIAILMIFLPIYNYMQWISITIWDAGPFAQIFLNIKRQSTQGLSIAMIILGAVCAVSFFFSIFFLIMPVQNLLLCYFANTGTFILSLQVIQFWNWVAPSMKSSDKYTKQIEEHTEDLPPTSATSIAKNRTTVERILKIILSFCLFLALTCLVAALIWRLESWFALFAPVCIIALILFVNFYYTSTIAQSLRTRVRNHLPSKNFPWFYVKKDTVEC